MRLDTCAYMAPLENTSLMPSAFTHKDPEGQLQSTGHPSCRVSKIPIWRICIWTLSRLRLNVSDQDRFDTAYEAFQDLATRGSTSENAAGVFLLDGYEKLQEMVYLPRTWPLARLTIPLEGLSKQIDRLLEEYCFQILATNRYPEGYNGPTDGHASHLDLG